MKQQIFEYYIYYIYNFLIKLNQEKQQNQYKFKYICIYILNIIFHLLLKTNFKIFIKYHCINFIYLKAIIYIYFFKFNKVFYYQ